MAFAPQDRWQSLRGCREMAEQQGSDELTADLQRMSAGDREAEGRVYKRVLEELRTRALATLRRQRGNASLQPTELVQEAYLKLAGQQGTSWKDRKHFYCVAARAMRSVVVDRWRRQNRVKRSSLREQEDLDQAAAAIAFGENGALSGIDMLDLNEAVEKLGQIDPRAQRIVELHVFLEQPLHQAAAVLGLSPRTAARDWQFARTWLAEELGG